MPQEIAIRLADAGDAGVLADHRVAMFRDMGSVSPTAEAELRAASAEYFAAAIPSGEYVGWVAYLAASPHVTVGGAGVQLRALLPRPDDAGREVLRGREGLVLNVYVDRFRRRRGLGRRLMAEILRWTPTAGIVRLVLHASPDGRSLYEALGFEPTTEMRYTGGLAPAAPLADS